MKFTAVGIVLTCVLMLIVSIGISDPDHPTPVEVVVDGLRLTPAPGKPLYFPASDPTLDPRTIVYIATTTGSTTAFASAQPEVATPMLHASAPDAAVATIPITPQPQRTVPATDTEQSTESEQPIQTPSVDTTLMTDTETPTPVTPTPTPKDTPAIRNTKPADVAWGVFSGGPTGIAEFESYVPHNPDYLAYFVHWGNGEGALPAFLGTEARDKGRTLVLFWEASDYLIGGTDQPAYAYRNILDGDFDDYFADFYKQLEEYGGEVILIPFSELNGNWTPWSGTTNGNSPAEAVAAFRKVYRTFSPLPNVKIGLAYNAASVPNTAGNQIENYYPGSDYVDIIGVDGFNGLNNVWLSFDDIFGRPLERLAKYNKPVMIFSYASGEGPNKDEWLYDMYYEQLPKHPYVTGWVYFNQNKEMNWLIWSDEPALEVFTETVEKLNEG